jgi:hypothetical protein
MKTIHISVSSNNPRIIAVLLPLSNPYSTHTNVSQNKLQVSALCRYTRCYPSHFLIFKAVMPGGGGKQQQDTGLCEVSSFWSIEHISKIWLPLLHFTKNSWSFSENYGACINFEATLIIAQGYQKFSTTHTPYPAFKTNNFMTINNPAGVS